MVSLTDGCLSTPLGHRPTLRMDGQRNHTKSVALDRWLGTPSYEFLRTKCFAPRRSGVMYVAGGTSYQVRDAWAVVLGAKNSVRRTLSRRGNAWRDVRTRGKGPGRLLVELSHADPRGGILPHRPWTTR